MQADVISDAHAEVLQTPVVWFMALAAALGTASICPLKPAIADVAGCVQFAPSHMLSTQFGALATALAVNAVVGTPWLLGVVIGVVGAGSSAGAQLSSVAGRFANPRAARQSLTS